MSERLPFSGPFQILCTAKLNNRQMISRIFLNNFPRPSFESMCTIYILINEWNMIDSNILTKTGASCWWSGMLALRKKREKKIQLENPLPISLAKFVFLPLTQRTCTERQWVNWRTEEWFINEKTGHLVFGAQFFHVHGAFKWFLAIQAMPPE